MATIEFSNEYEPPIGDEPALLMTVAPASLRSLVVEMRYGRKPLATATGFVVDHAGMSYLVTNKHNLSGMDPMTGAFMSSRGVVPDEVAILYNRSLAPARYNLVVENLYDAAGERLWREHPTNSRVDVVALPLTELTDVVLHPYSVERPARPFRFQPGDSVSVIGFPYATVSNPAYPLPTWSHGYVATEPMLDEDRVMHFMVDTRTRRGQSGSPVVIYRPRWSVVGMTDAEGNETLGYSHEATTELIGIYSGRMSEPPDEDGEQAREDYDMVERRIARRLQTTDLGIVWKHGVIRDVIENR